MNRIYVYAKKCIGLNLAPNYMELGCCEAINNIFLDAIGEPVVDSPSTTKMYVSLCNDKRFIKVSEPIEGDLIISPTGYGNGKVSGHCGIVSDNNKIMSNNSKILKWDEHYTLETWKARYSGLGNLPIYFFRFIDICSQSETQQEIKKSLLEQLVIALQKLKELLLKWLN